ncbi:MAG: hypothetical protein ACR2F8_03155 [Caulobacteraceae bacterium]
MHRIDTPGNVAGLFAPPDPVHGQVAVIVDSAWLNDLQENIMGVLAGAGIAPVKGDYTQLDAAIDILISGGTTRRSLTANRTFYVAPAGNDAHDGLTLGTAWLTIQHAVDTLLAGWDMAGFTATIQCAAGAYNAPVGVRAPFVGAGSGGVVLQGDTATPANCTITTGAGFDSINCLNGAVLRVQGFTVASAQSGLAAQLGGVLEFEAIAFGACVDHLHSNFGGSILAIGAYSVVAGADHHAQAFGGQVNLQDTTITLTGTPAFTAEFLYADALGVVFAQSLAFSGTGSGSGWLAARNGYVDTDGTSAAITGAGFTAGSTSGGGIFS